ncbi:MAG: polysaccharide biosynthesis protein [Xanthobacteraceae bacterium]|nr:polysaccharide biosynthesis protein [Xanthobacteraceae bacterium]
MLRLPQLAPQRVLTILHDVLVTAVALVAAFLLRFEPEGLVERRNELLLLLPGFLVFAAFVFYRFRLYRSKWRFASLPDVANILGASTVLAFTLVVIDYVLVAPNIRGSFLFGKITIVIYWLLQVFLLGGPRIAYRYFRYARTRRAARVADASPVLVLGRAADAEVLIRAIESGAVKRIWPIGILSPSPTDQNQSIRGISVLGGFDDLEDVVAQAAAGDQAIARVILTPAAMEPQAHPEKILLKARRLGLQTQRLPSLGEGSEALQLAPVQVEDLLLRPSVRIDYDRLQQAVAGKSIVVTGGGGSIGAEICDRIVTFGAARVLVIENSEPALHAVLEALASKQGNAAVEGRIADVRDRTRMFHLIRAFKPDIVFHAAALKHVPLVEQNWDEGIKTNIFGSVNIADATVAAGAAAMVMISTDKAIEPVSVLGATKRFAEMYCQDLDRKAAGHNPRRTRLISVRFGNVLASNGSVVPKFKAQIEAGGPVTVTHPGMVRYFMTIREACDLVVTAAIHSLDSQPHEAAVYLLNMGQPVRIVELAERMIVLSGLEPQHDIDVVFTGIRPGERLAELLFARDEPRSDIGIEGIMAVRPVTPPPAAMKDWLAALERGVADGNRAAAFKVLSDSIPDFRIESQ